METSDCEGFEAIREADDANGRQGGPCPCTPKLFAVSWERSVGPLRRKPFSSQSEAISELIDQEAKLITYAPACSFSDEKWRSIRRQRLGGGAEHDVFVVESAGNAKRVWKRTKEERWGFKFDTPIDYLDRLQALTDFAQVDIKVEGVVVEFGKPSIVTSMTYVHGRHMTNAELNKYLRRTGWTQIADPTQLMAYELKRDGQIIRIRDAHAGNFIYNSGVYIPIDIGVEYVGSDEVGEEHREI